MLINLIMYIVQKYKRSPKISGGKIAEVLRLKVYTQKIKPKKLESAINWGLSKIPWLSDNHKVYNHPDSIVKSSNKLTSFQLFKENGVSIPLFFTRKDDAASFLNGKNKVVCRTILTGSSGSGIVIASSKDELVDCRLYVQYLPKQFEYRYHVFNGSIIHRQQKKRLTTEQLEERGIVERNKFIRNLANGYIFSSNFEVSDTINKKLEEQALLACSSLGLDFGGVDLIANVRGDVYVLEVNSAPGLEGETLSKYIQAVKALEE